MAKQEYTFIKREFGWMEEGVPTETAGRLCSYLLGELFAIPEGAVRLIATVSTKTHPEAYILRTFDDIDRLWALNDSGGNFSQMLMFKTTKRKILAFGRKHKRAVLHVSIQYEV